MVLKMLARISVYKLYSPAIVRYNPEQVPQYLSSVSKVGTVVCYLGRYPTAFRRPPKKRHANDLRKIRSDKGYKVSTRATPSLARSLARYVQELPEEEEAKRLGILVLKWVGIVLFWVRGGGGLEDGG